MFKNNQYEVVKKGNVIYGAKPLQSIDSKATNLVFGGELVGQSIIAAWETVPGDGWSPNSFHGYFIRPATVESVIRYDVVEQSNGKNFRNRLVSCYQDNTDKLVFVAMISFGYNNNSVQRIKDWHSSPNPNVKSVPYDFQFKPNDFFYKYKDNMEELMIFNTTNDSIQAMVPPEIFEDAEAAEKTIDIGNRRLGFFTRVNTDDVEDAKSNIKANYADLGFVTDATTLVIFFRSLGIAFNFKYFWYKYASMDHNIYFHDNDFNITEWIFIDYRFTRLSNGRVLFETFGFNTEGKLIVSVYQEAQVQIPKKVADQATGGYYKL